MVLNGVEGTERLCTFVQELGVVFLVKNEILHDFNVITLDDSNDDILWLQLENIYDGFKLIACVCYLPPENSSRQVDANTFF